MFGGGVAQTVFNPIVGVVILIVGVLICVWPRHKAIAAFLAAAILIPTDQVLLVGGFHFPAFRILILFGLARIIRAKATSETEIFSGGMNWIDKALILMTIFTAVDGVLLWQQSGEFFFQLGNVYTAFGLYFLLRFLIRDQEDVERTIRVFAYIAAVVALLMVYEQMTGRNPVYGLLGGARAAMYGTDLERADKIRATASFGHPILAGTFGAILLPLFFGLWLKDKNNRTIALVGMIAATAIPIASNSSTSLLGWIGGVGALCCWPFRKLMRPIRWGILVSLVFLQLVKKSPVWHLITDVDLTGSSSSYHRYQLVNQSILHFWNWMLIGTKSYASWGWDMWDLSNQYVAIGDVSGLVPLIFFVAMIVLGFKYLGMARKTVDGDRKQELFIWAVGAALFANMVAFFGISYFDQTIVVWYALMAIIAVATLAARSHQLEPCAAAETAKPEFAFHRPFTSFSTRFAKSGQQQNATKTLKMHDSSSNTFSLPTGSLRRF